MPTESQVTLEEALSFDESSPVARAPGVVYVLSQELKTQVESLSHHQTHQVLQAIQLLQSAVRPRD
jgi:hypothetical protein